MRPYRIVSGISYPSVFVGDNQPNEISTHIDASNRGYYYDESIKLNSDDIAGFVGKPICLEHDPSVEVGQITAAWKDRDNHMRITARIFTDTAVGEQTFHRINNGDLRGFSVGYDVHTNQNRIVGKDFNEISVCQEPFFPGAAITVAASKQTGKSEYKSNGSASVLNFKIMAEQKIDEVPLDQANKDSSEIARVHDEVLKANEAMKAELEALKQAQAEKDAKIKQYDEEKLAQRQAYAESQKPVLEEVLAIQTEQLQQEEGNPEAQLHPDYVESTTAAFMAPEAANVIKPIVASARSWKKNQLERKKREEENAELNAKLQKMQEENSIAEAHVRASARRLNMATGQQQQEEKDTTDDRRLAVTAGMDLKNLFVPKQPSEQERELLRSCYGRDASTVSVTASAGKELPPIPVLANKNLAESVPNSMRNHPGGKYLFHQLVMKNAGYQAMAVPGIKQEPLESFDH